MKNIVSNEPESSVPSGDVISSYEQMVFPAKAFLGAGPKFEPLRLESIAPEYYALAHELLEVLRPAISAARYCYQVIGFLQKFAEIEKQRLPQKQLTFLVIDLVDYCDGLVACNRIVTTLMLVYEQHSTLRMKIAAAECVGRLFAGLPESVPMFMALLSAQDPDAKSKVSEAIARTLTVQARLASNAAERGQELFKLYVQTKDDIENFREQLPKSPALERIAVSSPHTESLGDFEFLSQIEKKGDSFVRQHDARITNVEPWPDPPPPEPKDPKERPEKK